MSGHNKWSKIKHKKAATDAEKSKMFSKLVKLIKVEARLAGGDENAPALKAAVEKARSENMPKDTIERAIKSATDGSRADEKVLYEFYGPGGVAVVVEGLTDNTNRTSSEIKHLLSKQGFELATPGSALWAFERSGASFEPTTLVPLNEVDGEKLEQLIKILEEHIDVQDIYTNIE
jgi:YebC/PmpR family DNA-binding regulatory protein